MKIPFHCRRMSHLNDVKKSEQRRVKKKKQTNKKATQRERASINIKV